MHPSDHNPHSETSELLKKLKNSSTGFKTPPDYFNQLQSKMIDQVIEPEVVRQMTWLENIFNNVQLILPYKYAIAGVIVFTVVASSLLNQKDVNLTSEIAIASLSQDDLDYFIDNELSEINNQDLIATLEDDMLSEVIFESPNESLILPESTLDEYIEEMDDNNLLDFEINN